VALVEIDREDAVAEHGEASALRVWVSSMTQLPPSALCEQHVCGPVVLVDAVHGAGVNAGSVLLVDTSLGDDRDAAMA
jgi:hypothetical protein